MSMNLQQQLRQLERQRATELKNANILFARAKRDTRRMLSPDRMIRKHLGVSLAAAFVGAMLLAPSPRRHAQRDKGDGGKWSILLRALTRLVPQLRKFIPGLGQYGAGEDAPGADGPTVKHAAREGNANRPRPSLLAILLAEVAPILAAKFPWQQFLSGIMSHKGPREADRGGDTGVEVGNVGTQQADVRVDGL